MASQIWYHSSGSSGAGKARARLAGLPSYGSFCDDEPPLRGAQLTTAIVLGFEHEATRRSQMSTLVIFPGREVLDHYCRRGRWRCQSVINTLETDSDSACNFRRTLLECIGPKPPEWAFRNHHYAQDDFHQVADSRIVELAKRGWISPHGQCVNYLSLMT